MAKVAAISEVEICAFSKVCIFLKLALFMLDVFFQMSEDLLDYIK